MSELKVEIIKIDRIEVHPNADRLSLAFIAGWQVVVQRGAFLEGWPVVYFPIDSILPPDLEAFLFPPDSKVKLDHSRIRTIKLRKAISQGMIASLGELRSAGFLLGGFNIGDDVADKLGVTKYEPPEKFTPQSQAGKKVSKRKKNSFFKEYSRIDNFKWYPDLFKEGDNVIICEKIHGSSFRAGYVPFDPNTIWKKLKKWLGFVLTWEFVYGSHKVQLQDKRKYNGYYDKNIYWEAVVKYDLIRKVPKGYVIYGEIYGDGVQKNYTYGCAEGERKLVVFDIQVDGKYLDAYDVLSFCKIYDLPHVPIEHIGEYPGAKVVKELWVDGVSNLCKDQKVREGVVIKPVVEQQCYMGRQILKYKSDEFLIKAEDDTH